MSQQRIDLNRVTVHQSNLPRNLQTSHQAQLISGHRQINTNSSTGYHSNVGISRSGVGRSGNAGAQSVEGLQGNLIGHPQMAWKDLVQQLVINGDTDFTHLKNMKDAMLQLNNEFRTSKDIKFDGAYKQNFEKRLTLLEHEFDGLIRRVLNIKYMYPDSGARNVDYMKFITELQNKIDYLERQLSRADSKNQRNLILEIDGLKIEGQRLREVIRQKDCEIRHLQALLKNQWALSGTGKSDAHDHISSLSKQLDLLKTKSPTMDALQQTIEAWIVGLPNCGLQQRLEAGTLRIKEHEHYLSMIDKLGYAQDLFANQMKDLEQQIKQSNSSIHLPNRSKVLDVLSKNTTKVGGISSNGFVEIQRQTRVERQIPVADERTKALVNSLGKYVRKIITKYPKLKQDMDIQIQQFISTEMIDTLLHEDLDRIVQITKYVPQMVRVQNVYTYDSQKTRKVQFHLRILLRSLLAELYRVQQAYQCDIAIDEGIIGMIRTELLNLVDQDTIESIMALYRSVPKVREVPKVIEKVAVETSQVPHHIILDQKTATVHPLSKVEVAKDTFGVRLVDQIAVDLIQEKPLRTIDTIQKPIVYTNIREKAINTLIEKTNTQAVEQISQKIVEVDRPGPHIKENVAVYNRDVVQVPVIQNHFNTVIEQVLQTRDLIVQKVVQRLVTRQKPVPVPLVQQKLVKQTNYQIVKQKDPILVTKYEVLKEIQEKLIEAIQTRQQIVPVEQVKQKIVEVQRIIDRPVQLPPVKQEVFVPVPLPPQIVCQKQFVPERVEVQKIIDRFIQKPIFVQHVNVVEQTNPVPIVTTIQKVEHVPVDIMKPFIMNVEKPVQIPVSVPVYVREQVPVHVKEESTIPVPIVEERIRTQTEVKEKIIQKIVEVPKTVTVQKIVQKIVVVPRIVQKIVQVPQIIQKIVQVRIEVPVEMPPIERIIQRPCVVQKVVQVPVQKIVYLTTQKQCIVPEQILVKDKQIIREEIPVQILQQRIVVQRQQVPINCIQQKIQTLVQQKTNVVVQQKVLPVEIKVPVPIQKTVPVILEEVRTNVLRVPQVFQKLVIQTEEKVIIEPVQVVREHHHIEKDVVVQYADKYLIQDRHHQVQLKKEVLVQTVHQIQKIKEVPVVHEQAIPLIKQIPKIFQYPVPNTIALEQDKVVQVVKPYIVNINKYIEQIRQKLINVPYLIQQTQCQKLDQPDVILQTGKDTYHEKQVCINTQKELRRQVQVKTIQTVHKIQQCLQKCVDVIERDKQPVILIQDRIVEVPYVVQKIVQKITMMPQIVQVLKHVHQLAEEDNLDALVGFGAGVEWSRYRELIVILQPQISAFIEELIRLKTKHPQHASKIQFMQLYLVDLRKLLLNPHALQEEVVVRLIRDLEPFLDEMNKLKSISPQNANRIQFLVRHISELRQYMRRPNFLFEIKTVIRVNDSKVGGKEIIRIPRQKTAEQKRQELSRVLLIEQLLGALRKIEIDHKVNLNHYLQDEVQSMFGVVFNGSVSDVTTSFERNLKKFTNAVIKKFDKLDGWTIQQQQMLKSFIDERFQLASVIKQMKQQNKKLKSQNSSMHQTVVHQNSLLQKSMSLMVEFTSLTKHILNILQKDSDLYRQYMSLHDKFKQFERIYEKYRTKGDFGGLLNFDAGKFMLQKYMGSHERELVHKITLLEDQLRNGSSHRVSSSNNNSQYELTISRLRGQIARLETALRTHSTKELTVTSPKGSGSVHTNISPNKRQAQHVSSQSDVQSYGANFGGYINADTHDVGIISNRRQYFPSYGSSVQVARDLANSSATSRSNHGTNYVNSSQHIRVEGSGVGQLSVDSRAAGGIGGVSGGGASGAGYGSANTRYGNNVQITTSRITTQKGELGSGGQISSTRYEGGGGTSSGNAMNIGSTGTGTRGNYQFYQKKYERK